MIFLKITVKKIIELCNGKLILGVYDSLIEKYSIDTRYIKSGDMYIGIKGENLDGNDFIEEALEKGAIGCITDSKYYNLDLKKWHNKIIIEVDNSVKALQDIASYVRMQYAIPVIGITGSVGKTSTKDLIASVVGRKYKVLKTEGNLNNHIGLPLTLLNLDNQEAVVVEMGMSHLGEISILSKIARPTISVITNVGTSHLGNLGSRENILKAKLEILDGMNKDGILLINNDNDLLHNWYINNSFKNTYTYGIDNASTYTAKDIVVDTYSSSFKINNKKIFVNIPGKHFVYNALSAFAIGKLLNIDEDEIINGISEFTLTSKRMEIRNISNNSILIEDYYNASFESISMALDVLSKLKNAKKIAVLGDVLELGDFSDEVHKKIGKEVYKIHPDVLITVGNAAKNIANQAKMLGLEHVYICENNCDAVKCLQNEIIENTAILIKASHGMNFGEIAKELK